ncbi:hypothetical protein [Saccharopolyspora spinosa]|uniref:hypothetical protein n=1 Tax=Saccharopolyspora spinosa TaxID=60894 RepID=UPI0002378C34|nr:hypothetical protein [Saccharopolyspora spinosa]
MSLPGVTAEFHRPDHYIPTRDDLASAAEAVRGVLPDHQTMAFYRGLGALTLLGLMDWPVAAAIGVGVAVAQRAGGPASK